MVLAEPATLTYVELPQTLQPLQDQNCVLGNSMKSPTVNDACLINKAIRKLKRDTVSLSFHCGSIDGCTLVVFCDASFASLPNGGSQGAFILFS